MKRYNQNNYMLLSDRIIKLLPLEYNIDNYMYNEYVDIETTIKIVRSFLNSFDKDLLNLFNNIYELDENSIKLISKDTIEEEFSSRIELDTGNIIVPINNDISDTFHIVHEFIHKINYHSINPYDINFSNFGEVVPITIELQLYKYLINNNMYVNASTNYIKNRFNNNIIICYFTKFIKFIKDNYNIDNLSNLYLDREEFISKIYNLDNNIKEVFINNFDYFILIIKSYNEELDAYLFTNLRYNYAILLAPYLLNKDSKYLDLINNYAYSNIKNIPKLDNNLIDEEFNKYLSKLYSREKIIK